jgi:cyclopropane fatty-acyl-phospholipid synthase-like methyltransferase
MASNTSEQQVSEYYDQNTGRFLRLARRSAPSAIHQPLYLHTEMSLTDALHTQHQLILDILKRSPEINTVLDLGCGVGESMIFLARKARPDLRCIGITLSKHQAVAARSRIAQLGLQSRVSVVSGSFLALPDENTGAGLSYAIESFIHTSAPEKFFSEVARTLQAGGYLVIFDDFMHRVPGTSAERRIVDDMRQGWLANTLWSPEKAASLAETYGLALVNSEDYSYALKLNRWRDRLLRSLVPVARLLMRRSQYCRFMVGGDARQRGYQAGLFEYRMIVLKKEIGQV